MAATKLTDLLKQVRNTMIDAGAVRWTWLELQEWVNAAYREIAAKRPDSCSYAIAFNCVAGVRQDLLKQLPQTQRLLEVTRNTAADSRKGVVALVDRQALGAVRPFWPSEDETLDIQNYMYDPRLPTEFMVYPPAKAGAQLEVLYVQLPVMHSLTEQQLAGGASDTIRLDDCYVNAIMDYVLFRAFTKDAGAQGDAQRAMAHFQSFQSSMGDKSAADSAATAGTA